MSSTLHNQVNGILEQFAAQVELDSCQLDEDGCAQFALDDILISLMLDDPAAALLLMATVGQVPATAEAYGKLLDANLFFAETAGTTLARDSGSNMIVVQRRLPCDGLDITRFESGLQGIADVTERMRAAVAGEDAEAPEDDAEPEDEHEDAALFIRG